MGETSSVWYLMELFIFLSVIQFSVFGFWYLGIRNQVSKFNRLHQTANALLEKQRFRTRRR